MTFRFDAKAHAYYLEGVRVPSITQMLEQSGWVNTAWYSEEGSTRGSQVHALTAAYDSGVVDVAEKVEGLRAYLLAHIKAMSILRPEFLAVEVALVHPELRFGGRPDRVLRVHGLLGVLEIKSGGREKSHAIQTALQSILVAPSYHLPAEALGRYCLYLKRSGKYSIEEHVNQNDFIEARRVIRECCR